MAHSQHGFFEAGVLTYAVGLCAYIFVLNAPRGWRLMGEARERLFEPARYVYAVFNGSALALITYAFAKPLPPPAPLVASLAVFGAVFATEEVGYCGAKVPGSRKSYACLP
ncbi:MAG TPA: hypothetical protein VF157_09285 [Chloroflexota bacterium]